MKQKLGPRQLAWVEALEAHPERQFSQGALGFINDDEDTKTIPYKACCLGEACLVKSRLLGRDLPFNEVGNIPKNEEDQEFLDVHTMNFFKFRSADGRFLSKRLCNNYHTYNYLYTANDDKVSWTDIAEFVRNFPEEVFTEEI